MRKLAFLFSVMLMTHLGYAQTPKDVTGKVTDANGQPLSGTTISNKTSGASTVTNAAGTYSIKAKSGDLLVFSMVSFADQERTVGASTTINVSLQTAASQLSDVVVVGYGRASRKALTSSITSIRHEEMNRGPITDVGALLQGKVPGFFCPEVTKFKHDLPHEKIIVSLLLFLHLVLGCTRQVILPHSEI